MIRTELTTIFDGAKSFYKKAHVERNEYGEVFLVSYNTKVAKINSDNEFKILGFYSDTTLRHQKEFFRQFYENRSITKKELEKFIV